MPEDLKDLLKPTHCWDFVRESLKDSENFKMEELNYVADGLLATYSCKLDGRKYTVLIKERR